MMAVIAKVWVLVNGHEALGAQAGAENRRHRSAIAKSPARRSIGAHLEVS